MQLLKLNDDGKLSLVHFHAGKVPIYAILSHTWEADDQEVTFKDVMDGVGSSKLGYGKIRFCAEQARTDGLIYFWIDSCCIDKSSSAILQEAINSMFRWYKNAVKCYVYLSDVSSGEQSSSELKWESAFRQSRWFTRGWTLQELLAPSSVEFFSREGKRLGDKASLQVQIQHITGIPVQALEGSSLSGFGVDVRMSWANKRQTTIEEDQAYCLLGIFDTYLPLIYGEGKENAFRRLQKEIRGFNQHTVGPAHYIPFSRNKSFVGRSVELETLMQTLFITKECQKAAIVGLGGVGKTQLALQFAYMVKETRPEYSIFWMPALSMESFEQACSEIAIALNVAQTVEGKTDVKELVQRHLSMETAGPWLLIVDNADDMDVVFGSENLRGITDYLPRSEEGLLVFTTRTQEAAVPLAGKDVVELEAMSQEEALGLLRSLVRKDLLSSNSTALELLNELTFLPLAIAQAAAYLNTTRIPVSEYLRLLRSTEQNTISLLNREFYDSARYKGSKNAVATTWLVSFNQILKHDPTAADLLSFMSCIEPKAIPRSILPTVEPEERMVHAIGTLCSYALISRRADQEMFDLHRLVHVSTKVWLDEHGYTTGKTETAIRRLAEVFPSDDWKKRALWREYLPHALRVLEDKGGEEMKERYDLCFLVGRCLRTDGRLGEAIRWLEEVSRWRSINLGQADPDQLASLHYLARAYRSDRQAGKAVKLLEHVVAVDEKLRAEEHPKRLLWQNALASAYEADGQVVKAIKLLEHVVAVQEKVLAEGHPTRLSSQHALAGAYTADGQLVKAVKLLEHVVAVDEKVLSEEHPERLSSQHALASAYTADKQVAKAVKLLEHVVAVQEKVLAEEHPKRLSSQHELARAYKADGQIGKAVKLLEYVVSMKSRVMREDHPSRLRSEEMLRAIREA